MSPLQITHDATTTGPVLHVDGELDYEYSPALRALVERLGLGPGEELLLDLTGLQFCDSTGISTLLAARQHAQAAGAEVVLAAVPPHTLRILTLVGLDRVFTIRPADGTA
ncbi:STAS domain-containing protein [Streptomyces sp. PTM05]|uniref:Anti-sigma factor antagonist n=1 Tax=Streptantibioticus parmotrematis TaxID=2873249 RepID=A0ABS7R1N7_9ACTN|nr:STAS domain-containing protein [Streptantibioticus parmotrematis]MBY8888844.1 STAS domain-containing protein [Streptantibioticus parmotrematis]